MRTWHAPTEQDASRGGIKRVCRERVQEGRRPGRGASTARQARGEAATHLTPPSPLPAVLAADTPQRARSRLLSSNPRIINREPSRGTKPHTCVCSHRAQPNTTRPEKISASWARSMGTLLRPVKRSACNLSPSCPMKSPTLSSLTHPHTRLSPGVTCCSQKRKRGGRLCSYIID